MSSDSSAIPGPALAADRAGPPPVPGRRAGWLATLWRRLLDEPLLHFLVLGGLIFGIDAVLHPPGNDQHTIVVTHALRQSFIDGFDEDKERKPSPEDLQKMIDAWVGSEILYREGKAMAVDRGDDMIRDRIAYKLQLLIFDQVKVDQPTDAQLQTWFANNHARFDTPETVGFYYTLPTDEATARRALADILAHRESDEVRAQTRAILARPVDSVASVFGPAFRQGLLTLPLGQWQVLQSKDGWHVVRLDSHQPGKQVELAQVRNEAARLWHTEAVRAQAWEAVKRLKTRYTVRYEP